jgi:hypothetical protein
MKEPHKRNKRLKRAVAVSIAMLSLTGCIETKPLLQGRRDGTASLTTNRVYHGCGYKDDLWMCHWNAGGNRQHHLFFVRPKYNYWYALAAVLSFGFYMPLDIEWKYDLGRKCDCKCKECSRK